MLLPLTNAPREYAWGSLDAIALLQGRDPSGRPEAEVWFGDHAGDPSDVEGQNVTLDQWLAQHGAAHGTPDRLPFLLKLLAAASPLSIQAHPSRAQAAAGFAREDAAGIPREAGHRTYRDDNHKPEVIVALSPVFEALAGFRPVDEVSALLAAIAGERSAGLRARLDAEAASAVLRETVHDVLTGRADALVEAVRAGLDDHALPAAGASGGDVAADLAALRAIHAAYPGDPGVVVALLLNRVRLRQGEALFVPAGMPHAYLSGLGVEVMAASDNVVRGGLTPKHIDVAELMDTLDVEPGAPPRLAPRAGGPGVEVFAPPIEDFSLVRVTRDSVLAPSVTAPLAGAAIVLATRGAPIVADGEGDVVLPPGRAVLVTADQPSVRIGGRGEVFVARRGGLPES
ncbi:mannose-6-phosphate isomerase, class I [Microbacterium sp. LRZ72]|uniref:mannose-6-phosphate isomerase, class I n=1 Tax=Microbacterium sp. LRZ72 TaxID=2942481 RepID=UPI0029B30FFE|nr:mannose-6-phosphate isomerase, class I [Microbacterium sp. LRZ72]MDX2377036.1 mannose-6-phosphate isomerase, class I [Microbacterium sp. LRZ72]